MNHADHVYLLEGDPGVRERLALPIRGAAGTWADLGSGSGAFTLALADLLGPGAMIYSLDKDRSSLLEQELAMRNQFPDRKVEYRIADFTQPLDLPALDGLVMANSLHFLPEHEKSRLLQRLRDVLKPDGQFILVEYNADRGNMWVSHPLSYISWVRLAERCGYTKTARLGAKPSRFLGEIFSAVSRVG